MSNEDLVWHKIKCWITNSTVYQLLRRLILFASDLYTINEIRENDILRAREIASSRQCLSPLIGRMVTQLSDDPMDPTKMFTLFELLMPKWKEVSGTFKRVNTDLLASKYKLNQSDPNYKPQIEDLDKYLVDLHKEYMPMPSLAILIPPFRY